MTATLAPARRAGPAGAVLPGYRFELIKLLTQWRIRIVLLACWSHPAASSRSVSSQSLAPDRHGLRPLDARHRLGRVAGRARLRVQLGAAAADLAGRRRRLRRRGPARHLAAPPRRGPVAAPDLRGQGARQPHGDPAHGHRAGRLGHRSAASSRSGTTRWSASTATPSRPARRPARAARLAVRAGAHARVRRGRPARLGRAGSLADGAAGAGPARARDEPGAAAAAAGRRTARAAEQRLPRLARPVHRARRRPAPLLVGIAVSLVWAVARDRLAYRLFVRRDFTDLAYDGAGPPRPRHGGAAAGRPRRGHRPSSSPPPTAGPRLGYRPAQARGARCRPRTPTSTGCRPSSCTALP